MHPLVLQISDLFLRQGGAPAQEEADVGHEARIAWEWASDQWVLVTSKDNQLWGWMSWYRCSSDVLEIIRRDDMRALIERGDAASDFTQGVCLYIATAVVAPWAPAGTYRRLFELVLSANADAIVVCATLRKRDGRVRWLERRKQH